jgi:hypothetical protein
MNTRRQTPRIYFFIDREKFFTDSTSQNLKISASEVKNLRKLFHIYTRLYGVNLNKRDRRQSQVFTGELIEC